MNEIIEIKRMLEDMKSGEKMLYTTEDNMDFAKKLLALINEMQTESAASYYEGKAEGLEIMSRILSGAEE